MKLWLVVLHIVLVATNIWVTAHFHEELPEDNEFAEFEDFEEEKTSQTINDRNIEHLQESNNNQDFEEDDVLIVDGDSEFDHFQDEEEFEGLDAAGGNAGPKNDEPSTLTITKIPLHLRARWDSFYLEILTIIGLLVYFINYIAGRSKNAHIAELWLIEHKQLLLDNFSLVGDTGKSNEDTSENGLVKESQSHYSLYCSGRIGCDSMLIELKLIKRQDLVAVLAQLVRPQNDQAHIRVELAKEETDNFVLAIATKKTAMHLVRDMADISVYCPEKRPGEKFGLPSGFYVMSEIAEAASAILDTRVLQAFSKFAPYIDYIHISDQFSGPKQQEDTTQLTMPEVKRVLLVGLNITIKGRTTNAEGQEKLKLLLQLTFYLLDKLRRFKLSKEGKSKADKNRLRVEEAFLKITHAARAEAAAQRREERRRAEKERILQEEDPDKQRKWEEKEQRRLAKKRAPRMKQLKVKAL
ncbi:coiled-coil domain-containing protein 47 isoform X3 [Apis mellifera caucasica]|nr:coiled-coil domain-containing protein 47 isoform X3 [Apis mellifera]XP_026300646.1 coiled-coil domain-containing protein 47 isoform X3 [Apis mellifera]XP_026300647.1 coiled-coil domain-containing protein 47 isoform X3 [Apis mellifera]XP_396386.4 coiled-coil domain-containing protein 47 isoform X3 [Apis mellifera]KAG6800692.1 coiled-coil domain-containing protein 47 isoform X3 [Apis mellifera caucasica]|eukprot:XP_006565067.2 coiled-coil domain-containing protein 47 isoform X3 [Apis mellifera]